MSLKQKNVRELGQLLKSVAQPLTSKNKQLAPAPARAGIPAVNSSAKQATDTRQAGNAGIASPLTEGKIGDPGTVQRLYYDTQFVTSPDGLIVFEVDQLQRITFLDTQTGEVEVNFSQES